MLMQVLTACGKTASIEEYRKKVALRRPLSVAMVVLGLATLAFSFLYLGNRPAGHSADFFKGVYAGVGTALVVLGAVLRVRTEKLLADEAALKRERLKKEDERAQEIASRALRTAGVATCLVLYLVLLVAGVFYPALFFFCLAAVLVYFFSMVIAMAYYQRKL